MSTISSHQVGILVERRRMSVRGFGKRGREASRESGPATFFFRGPQELKDYVLAAARSQGQKQDEFIIEAIRLDRELAEKLSVDADRLEAFAARESLSLEHDAPEVLARLVRKGLDCQDVDCSQSKTKPKK